MIDAAGSPHPRHPNAAVPALERTRWPQTLEPLFGREQDLAQLHDRLRWPSTRILTLTGPGGVGKTRLALEYALTGQHHYPGGASFVDLSAVATATGVIPAIAAALDVQDAPGASLAEHIAVHLGDQRFLLVIDNFEHVLEAATDLLFLCGHCPQLTILVTSRARLRLTIEQEYRVNPLDTGERRDDDATAAVQLFVSEARRLVPEFTLTPALHPAILAICQRLDGLPLAIRLAAGRSNILDPPALLHRLEQRLPLLTTDTRDASLRQRTMRNTIAWSYALLNADEARLFRCLSQFAGGFTLELAEFIAEELGRSRPPADLSTSEDTPSVVDRLSGLVNHHLVERVATEHPPTRFAMLETIREFAHDRLAAEDDLAAVRRAHALAITRWAEAIKPHLFEQDEAIWLARSLLEQANLRLALEWAISQGDTHLAYRLVAANGAVWIEKGMFRESHGWLEKVFAMPGPAPADVVPICRFIAGMVSRALGHDEEALAHARAGLQVARASGDISGEGLSLLMESHILVSTDLDAAELAVESAIACLEQVPGKPRLASCLRMRTAIAQEQGDAERFRQFAATAYDYAVEVGDLMEMSQSLCLLAEAVLMDGNPSQASEHLSQAIELGRALDSQPILGGPMRLGVSIAAAGGDYRLAIRWRAAIEESTTRLGLPLDPCTEQEFTLYRSAARRKIGERAVSIEEETGRALPVDRAAAEIAAYRPGKRGAAALTELGVVRLTDRETEVLALIAGGLSDVEIADTLFIARPTASRHVSNILLKLQVHTRTAAVDKAHRAGLLPSPAP